MIQTLGVHIETFLINYNFFSDEYCDRDNILQLATTLVKSRKSVVSCTVQIERYNAEINSNCKECQRLQPC